MSWLTSCFPIFRRKPISGPGSPVDDWFKNLYAKRAVADPWKIERYDACLALRHDGISCLVWFEDVVRYYGAKTALFDLYLLVDDVDEAYQTLKNMGWSSTNPPEFTFLEEVQADWRWLASPDQGGEQQPLLTPAKPKVVLGSAKDWGMEAPYTWCVPYLRPLASERWPWIPPLPKFLESMFQKWLDLPDGQMLLRNRVCVMIAYIYEYVAVVKMDGFVDYLEAEYQHLHRDILVGSNIATQTFLQHSREVRQKIRDGHSPPYVPAKESLGLRRVTADEARLLAKMPSAHEASDAGPHDEGE